MGTYRTVVVAVLSRLLGFFLFSLSLSFVCLFAFVFLPNERGGNTTHTALSSRRLAAVPLARPFSRCFVQGNALFAYLLDIGAIRGVMQYIYWLVVSMGVALNVYRLYMVSE